MEEVPNLNYIDQLANGDLAIKKRLIDVIQSEFPEEVKQYRVSINSKNWQDAAALVHKIKHKIGVVGLEKTYEFAKLYEDQLKQNEHKYQSDFEQSLLKIELFLKEIKD